MDQLVVQLQVQVQVDDLANGCHGEDLHKDFFVTDSVLNGNTRYYEGDGLAETTKIL